MYETLTSTDFENTIRFLRPDSNEIKWIEGGDNRFVALVDGKVVFRFPKEESGKAPNIFEFRVLELVEGKLSVDTPKPIELAPDGAYNVQSFLPGKVISKKEAADLPLSERLNIGIALVNITNELNTIIKPEDLIQLKFGQRSSSNRTEYYDDAYSTACQQDNNFAKAYCTVYEQIGELLPRGFSNDAIIFGDFNPANLILSEDNKLIGIIDWTGLGFGDIHRELRPVYAIVGGDVFDDVAKAIRPELGKIDTDLVRLCAAQHELAVLVMGKQKGALTSTRVDLALYLLNQWLPYGWDK